MENASKALIIAGAILLAILLITLGIIIFSQAQDTINSVNMDEQEIMAFNNKFLPYQGRMRGSQVNALAQAILSNNQRARDNGETNSKGITVSGSVNISNDGNNTTINRVPTGSYYNVTFNYTRGLITSCTISPTT